MVVNTPKDSPEDGIEPVGIYIARALLDICRKLIEVPMFKLQLIKDRQILLLSCIQEEGK